MRQFPELHKHAIFFIYFAGNRRFSRELQAFSIFGKSSPAATNHIKTGFFKKHTGFRSKRPGIA
jgi:hypothetical protein